MAVLQGDAVMTCVCVCVDIIRSTTTYIIQGCKGKQETNSHAARRDKGPTIKKDWPEHPTAVITTRFAIASPQPLGRHSVHHLEVDTGLSTYKSTNPPPFPYWAEVSRHPRCECDSKGLTSSSGASPGGLTHRYLPAGSEVQGSSLLTR